MCFIEHLFLPLAGMLLSGLALRCISVFITPYDISTVAASTLNVGRNASEPLSDRLVALAAFLRVDKGLSRTLRQVVLATILTRAGLGLNPAMLKRTWKCIAGLTVMPCLAEAAACLLVSKFLMDWPWAWAGMMG